MGCCGAQWGTVAMGRCGAPQVLLFLALSFCGLYLMLQVEVGLDQELSMPTVCGAGGAAALWGSVPPCGDTWGHPHPSGDTSGSPRPHPGTLGVTNPPLEATIPPRGDNWG